MAVINDLRQINSTSYVDLLGLELGLERLPGESARDFLTRLQIAAASKRDASYEGLLTEVGLQLGLAPYTCMKLTCTQGSPKVDIDLSGVRLESQTETVTSAVVEIDSDGVWKWRMLSEIVADINRSQTFQATLVAPDGPAIKLAKQSNTLLVVGEQVQQVRGRLEHNNIILGSELFSSRLVGYTLFRDGTLELQQAPPDGLTITYRHYAWPYDIVACDVALIGLTDSGLQAMASKDNKVLVHQVQELLQAVMEEDRSYWAR